MPVGDQPSATIESASAVSQLLERAEFFPLRIDLERHAIVFVELSREALRRATFLDQREILAGSAARLVDLDTLFERFSARSRARPMHFILHGAFCGSTLLARHFEQLPHLLVLKEPLLLAQIAKLGNIGSSVGLGGRAWADGFDTVLSLLSRADADDAAVLIKAPDQVNWLADRLLERDRMAKVIFLCAPLRVFLLSALKSEDRREWVRSRGRGLRVQLSQLPFQHELVPEELTHAQLAAALWLLNNSLCSTLLAGSSSERILIMSSEELIQRPRESLHAAVEFLELTRDQDIRGALAGFSPSPFTRKRRGLEVISMPRRGAPLWPRSTSG